MNSDEGQSDGLPKKPISTEVLAASNEMSTHRSESHQGSCTLFQESDAAHAHVSSLEHLNDTLESLSKMEMCHDIALDRDFTLEKWIKKRCESGTESGLREQTHWQQLREELASEPVCYKTTAATLLAMKKELNDCLLPYQDQRKQRIDEVLDAQVIHQQADRGALDLSHYLNTIISNMSELCAPHLDDQIRLLLDLEDPVETMQKIIEVLQKMKKDLANFLVGYFRPHIVASAVEYEKERFQCALKALNPDTRAKLFHFTQIWLKRASDHLPKEDCKVVDKVVSRAYVDLLNCYPMEELPETLLVDKESLKGLQEEAFRLCTATAILLMIFSCGGVNVQELKEFKETVRGYILILLENVGNFDQLEEVVPSVCEKTVEYMNQTLQVHGFSKLDSRGEYSLRAEIATVTEKSNRISRIVRSRLDEFLLSSLSEKKSTFQPASICAEMSYPDSPSSSYR